MSELTTVRCTNCGGVGHYIDKATLKEQLCRACLGRGVRWSDHRPMTLCPETLRDTGAPMPPAGWRGKFKIACGRRGPTCPGCGRKPDEVGLDDDVKATMDRSEKTARPVDTNENPHAKDDR